MSHAQLCPQFSDEPGCVDSQPRARTQQALFSRRRPCSEAQLSDDAV